MNANFLKFTKTLGALLLIGIFCGSVCPPTIYKIQDATEYKSMNIAVFGGESEQFTLYLETHDGNPYEIQFRTK